MENAVNHVQGFIILKRRFPQRYRGIDRLPFEPTILDGEIISTANPRHKDNAIWKFYPPGWRQNAYRLFSENKVECYFCELPLMQSANVAQKILKFIPKSEGEYEVVSCRVFETVPMATRGSYKESVLIGYDVSYPGGDYYSAIKNGLLVHPHPKLKEKYSPMLNRFELFQNVSPIAEFIRSFKEYVPSESASKFIVVELRENRR